MVIYLTNWSIINGATDPTTTGPNGQNGQAGADGINNIDGQDGATGPIDLSTLNQSMVQDDQQLDPTVLMELQDGLNNGLFKMAELVLLIYPIINGQSVNDILVWNDPDGNGIK